MKITRYTNNDFQPITLEITIQTRQEMEDLLARLNAPPIRVNEGADGWQADGESSQDLYDLLYQEWYLRGY